MENKTELIDVPLLVNDYYKKIFFVFVPNVCDAQCYFCYIEPSLSKAASYSDSLLYNFAKFITISKEIGFNEFRFTGGEPLLFDNFDELVKIIAYQKVEYTLLTNGIKLYKHLDIILSKRPKKITISYHSKKEYEKIYGVSNDLPLMETSIKKIIQEKIPISITILLLPENLSEIISLIKYLIGIGIKSFKFVYPNFKVMKMTLWDNFSGTIKKLNFSNDITFRFSDSTIHHCMLKDRGFISLATPDLNVYNCCTTVSYAKPYSVSDLTIETLQHALRQIYLDTRNLTKFPCKSYLPFCPIALKSLKYKNTF